MPLTNAHLQLSLQKNVSLKIAPMTAGKSDVTLSFISWELTVACEAAATGVMQQTLFCDYCWQGLACLSLKVHAAASKMHHHQL